MYPVSVGPAVKALQRGQWNKSQGRWGKVAHEPGGEKIPTSGLELITCPSCENQSISGSVICESCGGTCFYEYTKEDNESYMAAWDAWASRKEEKEADESEQEEDPLVEEEVQQAKKQLLDKKIECYGLTCTKGPVTLLRKSTAKVRKHRCAWEERPREGEEYRAAQAANGVTFFSTIRARTDPWTPRGPKDDPHGEVLVSATDVVYFFFSALVDSAGHVSKNDEIPDGNAKELWRAITAALHNCDFSEFANRLMRAISDDDQEGFSTWLWDSFTEGLRKNVTDACSHDAHFHAAIGGWDYVKSAQVAAKDGLARLKVKFDLEASGKFEIKRAAASSGNEVPTTTAKGRGRSSQKGGGGRSAPTMPTRGQSSAQRWLHGASWASSSWGASSMALAVPDEREVNECALVVPQAQAINLVWWGIFACMFLCVLLALTCFILGWRCSSWWNNREAEGVVEAPVEAELPRQLPRATRPSGRRSKFTQCNRSSVDLDDIMSLTIDAIRN